MSEHEPNVPMGSHVPADCPCPHCEYPRVLRRLNDTMTELARSQVARVKAERERDEADVERARFASTNVTLGSQVDAERAMTDALMNALSYEGGPWPKRVGAAMQAIRDAREKAR